MQIASEESTLSEEGTLSEALIMSRDWVDIRDCKGTHLQSIRKKNKYHN